LDRFSVVLLLVFCSGILLSQNVVINEFLASNNSVVTDPEGEFDDWIEFYNNSTDDIDLTAWYLSDDSSIPDKWTFPDTILAAGEYLIIWADDDEVQGNDHAGFNLSVAGEEIILSDANLNIIDEIVYGVQSTDISLGRYPNGSGDFIQMNPTFGLENTDDYIPGNDPSENLFEQFVVNQFDLHFYVENWADSLEYNYYNGEEYFPAQLTFNDTIVLDSIGVRYKGNSSFTQSSTTPKKPFKFRFDKYIDDRLLYEISKLNFSNCVKDPTFMREVIAYQIAEEFVPSPRTAYANILVDGELLGFYVQVEQIDEFFLARHFEGGIGNLYKASDDGATLLYRGSEQGEYETEYELKTNENANDWSDFIDTIDKLNNTPDENFITTMETYLDLNECAFMLAYNMVLSHFDSYTGSGRNFYLYHDEASDQFKFLPWDLNETFGCYNNNWDVITQDIFEISNLNDRPLNQRFLENDELRELYLNHVSELIEGSASYSAISEQIIELQDFLDPFVQADPNKLYSYQDFLVNIDEDISINLGQIVPGLKSFSQLRNAEILQQLDSVSVYPGDCDNNGIVDEFDILPIGVYFLQTGEPRDEVSFYWQENSAVGWSDLAATYADANGDGEVNEVDVIGLGVNWGNTHTSQSFTFPIDPENSDLLEQHRSTFQTIYNSLNSNGEETQQIKILLESIYDFCNDLPSTGITLSNYPNPFNPSTTISFSLTTKSTENTKLIIYNLKGQQIRKFSIFNFQSSIVWDGTDQTNKSVSSGIYFYKLKSGNLEQTNKMILMK
jgi:CotH kinase protein/Lamin Tail Domain/Secretion system C-terminal sorting domain/Dockerin type I domain